MRGFPDMVELEPDETGILAWITFESREHRDEVQARFSKDDRVAEIMAEGPPFDPSRMAHGGFELLVEG